MSSPGDGGPGYEEIGKSGAGLAVPGKQKGDRLGPIPFDHLPLENLMAGSRYINGPLVWGP